MKVFSIIFAIIFLLFCIVQFNDPDPLLWILIYGSMAAVCIMAVLKKYPQQIYLILLGFFIGFSTNYIKSVSVWLKQDDLKMLFDEGAKMQNLFVEESREFLGLVICVAVLIFYLVRSRKLDKG